MIGQFQSGSTRPRRRRRSGRAFMNGLHHTLYVAAAIASQVPRRVSHRAQPCRVAGHRRASRHPSRYEPGVAARLPAAERRSAIVAAALDVFGSGGYGRLHNGGDCPRGGGFRTDHLPSFRIRSERCGSRASTRPGAGFGRRSSRRAAASVAHAGSGHGRGTGRRSPWSSPLLPNLWLQGVTEAAEDEEIQRYVAPTCARYTTSSPR